MKYVRRNPEVVDAIQWFSPLDQDKVGWYRHPEIEGHHVHEQCKRRWDEHGWIEPGWAYHHSSYFVGDLVCPGDYLIVHRARLQVAPRKAFERLYEPLKENEDAANPAGEG